MFWYPYLPIKLLLKAKRAWIIGEKRMFFWSFPKTHLAMLLFFWFNLIEFLRRHNFEISSFFVDPFLKETFCCVQIVCVVLWKCQYPELLWYIDLNWGSKREKKVKKSFKSESKSPYVAQFSSSLPWMGGWSRKKKKTFNFWETQP